MSFFLSFFTFLSLRVPTCLFVYICLSFCISLFYHCFMESLSLLWDFNLYFTIYCSFCVEKFHASICTKFTINSRMLSLHLFLYLKKTWKPGAVDVVSRAQRFCNRKQNLLGQYSFPAPEVDNTMLQKYCVSKK